MREAVLTEAEPQARPTGERRRLRVGVLISGSGTNLQALIDRSVAGTLDAEIVVVISNKEAAFGLERARRARIPAVWIDPAACESRSAYNTAIADALEAHDVELVVMAGYMRLLGTEVLDRFPGRVMNLHPRSCRPSRARQASATRSSTASR
jgi:formyltetrahydrofolate-dependent phosphoribosylglycinamide formyltransferase (EC 2.1.2.2)